MAIAHVQSTGSSESSSSASIAKAFVSNNTAGNTIVVSAYWSNLDALTCSDSQGNSYASITQRNDGAGKRLELFYAMNCKAGANTVTVTGTNSNSRRVISITEYSGVLRVGALDQSNTVDTNPGSSAQDGDTTPAVVPTVDGEVIYATILNRTGTWSSLAAGTSCNERYNEGTIFQTEDRIQGTAGSIALTWTVNNTDGYFAGIATLFPEGAYPYVVSAGTKGGTSLSGGVAMTMPTGIKAGDLLVAFTTNDAPGATTMGISGWTEKAQTAADATPTIRHAVFAKIAAGGDTATLTGASQDYSCVILLVANHSVSSVSTDLKIGTPAVYSVADAAPEPPSLDAGSSKKWLWLESFGADDDDDTANYETTSWTKGGMVQSANSTTSCLTAAASYQYEGQTLDPGQMYLAASEEWVANTLAVPPAVAGTAHEVNASEAIGLTDSTVGRMIYLRRPTDAVGLTDSTAQQRAYVRRPTETAGVTDSRYAVKNMIRRLTELSGVTDSISKTLALIRRITEATGITDSVLFSRLLTRIVAEGGGGEAELLNSMKYYNGSASGGITTPELDTTGADFLIILISSYQDAGINVISDSKGNGWTQAEKYGVGTNTFTTCYFCYPPANKVGTGHTFTFYHTTGSPWPTLHVMAWSGMKANGYDASNGDDTYITGNISPAEAGELLFSLVSGNTVGSSYYVPPSPWTSLYAQSYSSGVCMGTGSGYYNPCPSTNPIQCSWPTVVTAGSSIWAFKIAGGGTGGIGVTDSNVSILSAVVEMYISEAVGTTDSSAIQLVYVRRLTEAVGITEGSSAFKEIVRILSDSTGVSDTRSVSLAVVRVLSEATGLSDSTLAGMLLTRIVSDG